MLLATLAAFATVGYSFPTDKALTYDVSVGFDGYIPVFGGQQGEVNVLLSYTVKGETEQEGKSAVSGDITAFEVIFNGAKMPFQLESVKQYFPRTTVLYAPNGSILKNDAPDLQLPVKLPGLDVKRFPDITYLPIEFPEAGIEQDKQWTYRKSFGDSTVTYTITPTSISDERVEMDVALSQDYVSLEDSSKNPTLSEPDADYKVSTVVKGTGKATFDRVRNVVAAFQVTADATSTATEIKTGKTENRKLTTKLLVGLRSDSNKP